MGQVFLSHASADDAAVNTLAAWLDAERAGKLFVDHRDIPPGASWDRALPRQLRRSDAALLYVTRNWLESEECFAEYRASYYGSKPVVPVFVGKPDEGASPTAAQRFNTLCASVQGVQIGAIPPDPMAAKLLLGAVRTAQARAARERRARLLRWSGLSLALLVAVLLGLGLTFRDNVEQEYRAWQIARGFAPLSAEATRAAAASPGSTFRDCMSADLCPGMVVLPGGSFAMGASDDFMPDDAEIPVTEVSIPAFAVARHEVTLAQWNACHAFTRLAEDGPKCKELPVTEATARHPAASVSWHDAMAYVGWLNQRINGQTEGPYRLLSEAEWEYASRGVTSVSDPHTLYHWGDDDKEACAYANALNADMPDALDISRTGLDCPDNPEFATRVGTFRANAFGLKDMAGNVAEWVADCWHSSHDDRPEDASAWVTGVALPCERVIRGGSWAGETLNLRNAARVKLDPDRFGFNIGFRVARDLGG